MEADFNETCSTNIGKENLTCFNHKKTTERDVRVDFKIILQWILKIVRSGLILYGL